MYGSNECYCVRVKISLAVSAVSPKCTIREMYYF